MVRFSYVLVCLSAIMINVGECGHHNLLKQNASLVNIGLREIITMNPQVCPSGTYALQGWNSKCCSLADTLECGRRSPGNWAFNSSCQCSPILCPSTVLTTQPHAVLEPMKSFSEGGVEQIICDSPPISCQKNKPCASPSMIREPHTCNCLQISSPCESKGDEILLGNVGGPYQCMAFMIVSS
jgi:hypothetical protein